MQCTGTEDGMIKINGIVFSYKHLYLFRNIINSFYSRKQCAVVAVIRCTAVGKHCYFFRGA